MGAELVCWKQIRRENTRKGTYGNEKMGRAGGDARHHGADLFPLRPAGRAVRRFERAGGAADAAEWNGRVVDPGLVQRQRLCQCAQMGACLYLFCTWRQYGGHGTAVAAAAARLAAGGAGSAAVRGLGGGR